jgi:citrate synthase
MDELIKAMAKDARENGSIPEYIYRKYDVKRGLRNSNGTGVLVGLTDVGSVHGYTLSEGVKSPAHGRLVYRGYDIYDLVDGFQSEKRFGFEEVVYLLLAGTLPDRGTLNAFNEAIGACRELPEGFVENMILKIPSQDIMNKLQRSVLVLYSHDPEPDNTETENLIRQSIQLIAQFPTIISYGYQAKMHYFNKQSLYIHQPDAKRSTSENILMLTRPNCEYTAKEAEILDLLLVMHAEHGGGNNSTFAVRVVSSSGTYTYAAISAAIGSLKGPKHGGANYKVNQMVDDIIQNCSNWRDLVALKAYLKLIIEKKAFDKTGLIYGMGHAVYTLSDPRAVLLRKKARELAEEKGKIELFELYEHIEDLSKALFKDLRGEAVEISANLDLYSGFVYQMLKIPCELYTPLFATARVAGWCAHRIEQLISDAKIIRPAYQEVTPHRDYVEINKRMVETLLKNCNVKKLF